MKIGEEEKIGIFMLYRKPLYVMRVVEYKWGDDVAYIIQRFFRNEFNFRG